MNVRVRIVDLICLISFRFQVDVRWTPDGFGDRGPILLIMRSFCQSDCSGDFGSTGGLTACAAQAVI